MRLHDSSVACMIPPGDLLIFLDDKLIKWPISVDEEQGVILACTLNEKGQPYLDEQKGEVVKHMLRGRVDIVLKPNAPEHVRELYEKMRQEYRAAVEM